MVVPERLRRAKSNLLEIRVFWVQHETPFVRYHDARDPEHRNVLQQLCCQSLSGSVFDGIVPPIWQFSPP